MQTIYSAPYVRQNCTNWGARRPGFSTLAEPEFDPMKRICCLALVALGSLLGSSAAEEQKDDGWINLWDGKTFKNWQASENKKSWTIKDGAFVAFGPRSHLFYVGKEAPFTNFHFKCEVMTGPVSNGGIYFHTKYQENGWPKFGYEAQVNNTHGDPKKTGSLYDVKNVFKAPAKDNVWFTEEVIVRGRNIQIVVDGKKLVDFTEAPDRKAGRDFTRKLDKGTFAFQAHDPKSVVRFRKIMVKKLLAVEGTD